jgi:hypothetical protein
MGIANHTPPPSFNSIKRYLSFQSEFYGAAGKELQIDLHGKDQRGTTGKVLTRTVII